ncbi:Rpn family recombination-promoting nuclease/putative transposase [Wolbachia endosymbiont of Aedes albopictus]|nr:Rpn family recombination-promoting nuclease/putative transposase [Wolbachia endosymbiont of Aedes albopictus]UVW84530.1 Rpn family recombination-promoting nuclease/putative transposase [Wolbachia endosymbiont of Aedes albopictus]
MVLSKFLDPKNNYAFKRIFGSEKNKDILVHLLNDILGLTGEAKIKDVKFLNPILNPDIASQKESIVDVLCRDSKGIQTIVEMQVARTTGFEKRAQYYAAGAYFSQADVGGKYQDLKEVIFIAITDFVLFPEDSEHISTHHILNIKTYRHYLKDFKFVFIELPKFTKTKEDQLENIFEKWCYFFKYASETSEEDLQKIVGSDEVIGRAYNELVGYNWTKEERAIYYDDKKREDDNFSCIMQSRIEGKIEGKIEVAKNLLKADVSVDLIAESTGLPIDEIKKLKSN